MENADYIPALIMITLKGLFIWWTVHYAGKKGRDQWGWGVASFFFGFFPLIILAFLSNLRKSELA